MTLKKRRWEPAAQCPHNHTNISPDDGGYLASIRELCAYCLVEAAWDAWDKDESHPLQTIMDAALQDDHISDVTWHPEWRIGRQPKNFTHMANIYSLVEEWRAQGVAKGKDRYWIVASQMPAILHGHPPIPPMADIVEEETRWEGVGATPWAALAQAFVATLEQERNRENA